MSSSYIDSTLFPFYYILHSVGLVLYIAFMQTAVPEQGHRFITRLTNAQPVTSRSRSDHTVRDGLSAMLQMTVICPPPAS